MCNVPVYSVSSSPCALPLFIKDALLLMNNENGRHNSEREPEMNNYNACIDIQR